jgi:hypothetical protein
LLYLFIAPEAACFKGDTAAVCCGTWHSCHVSATQEMADGEES